jgi:hypothetical protein
MLKLELENKSRHPRDLTVNRQSDSRKRESTYSYNLVQVTVFLPEFRVVFFCGIESREILRI